MKPTAKELADYLSDFANNFSMDGDAFVDAFFLDHPTLVQKKIGLLLKVIEKAGSGEIVKQTRNQASIEACELVIQGYKDQFVKKLVSTGWEQEKAEEFVEKDFFSISNLPCI